MNNLAINKSAFLLFAFSRVISAEISQSAQDLMDSSTYNSSAATTCLPTNDPGIIAGTFFAGFIAGGIIGAVVTFNCVSNAITRNMFRG